MTPEQLEGAITEVESMVDLALPLVGGAEYVPAVTAAGDLTKKLIQLLSTHIQKMTPQMVDAKIDAEVAAKLGGRT